MPSRSLKILLLEDNHDLREGWLAFFQRQGHYVRGAALADEILDESGDFSPDVYVIDLNLPDANGLDVVKRLRSVQPHVGIIITTARTHIGDKVEGYDSGADIYFTKPVDPVELMASINSLAKRRSIVVGDEDDLHLQLDTHQLRGPTSAVDLTPSETLILSGLARLVWVKNYPPIQCLKCGSCGYANGLSPLEHKRLASGPCTNGVMCFAAESFWNS